MKKVALLFSLFAAACAWQVNPEHRYHVVYGDGVQTAEAQGLHVAMNQATKEWETATGNFITFTTDDEPGLPTITVYAQPYQQIESEFDGFGHTSHFGESSNVYIPYDASTEDMRRVATHELGHSLGLPHAEWGTLMWIALYGASPHITCADATHLCDVWGDDRNCVPEKMPVCQSPNSQP